MGIIQGEETARDCSFGSPTCRRETLNAMQEKKIGSKPEIEGCDVMRKLRLGYACASQKTDGEKVRAYACRRRALNHMA